MGNDPNHQAQYFGWLASVPPEYNASVNIPMQVIMGAAGRRPEVYPNRDFDHPYAYDYYRGITRQEAERRIHAMLDQLS